MSNWSGVILGSRLLWATPALLMRMSIWNEPSGLLACSLREAMNAFGPSTVPRSAWTGNVRMLCCEESCFASSSVALLDDSAV